MRVRPICALETDQISWLCVNGNGAKRERETNGVGDCEHMLIFDKESLVTLDVLMMWDKCSFLGLVARILGVYLRLNALRNFAS